MGRGGAWGSQGGHLSLAWFPCSSWDQGGQSLPRTQASGLPSKVPPASDLCQPWEGTGAEPGRLDQAAPIPAAAPMSPRACSTFKNS